MGGEVLAYGLRVQAVEAGEPCWHTTPGKIGKETVALRPPHPFPSQIPPKVPTTFPNEAISYGPSIQNHKPMGDFPYKIHGT